MRLRPAALSLPLGLGAAALGLGNASLRLLRPALSLWLSLRTSALLLPLGLGTRARLNRTVSLCLALPGCRPILISGGGLWLGSACTAGSRGTPGLGSTFGLGRRLWWLFWSSAARGLWGDIAFGFRWCRIALRSGFAFFRFGQLFPNPTGLRILHSAHVVLHIQPHFLENIDHFFTGLTQFFCYFMHSYFGHSTTPVVFGSSPAA